MKNTPVRSNSRLPVLYPVADGTFYCDRCLGGALYETEDGHVWCLRHVPHYEPSARISEDRPSCPPGGPA